MQSLKYGRQMAYVGFIFLLCLPNSYAQHYGKKFVIAPNNYLNDFSIDRIAQQVYADYYMGWIFKIDLKTMSVELTKYAGVAPAFGNKRHIMYRADTLYDIDKGTFYKIVSRDSVGNWPLPLDASFSSDRFSPSDRNLVYSAYFSTEYPNNLNFRNYCLSLTDSTLSPIDTAVIFSNTHANSSQWSSDSSFIFTVPGDSCLAEYFIHSRKIDTLITLRDYRRISGFAYNSRLNILAYAVENVGAPPQIYFHNRGSATDSLAFSPFRDDSDFCWSTPINIRFLCWSPNGSKLGFVPFLATNPGSGVYFLSLDSNKTYKAAKCDDPGLKYGLEWASEDTLIYINAGNGVYQLYGMDVRPVIDAIYTKKKELLPDHFGLTSYPNPFNPTATIVATIPVNKNAVLSIYDVQGRLVQEYKIKGNGMAKYELRWEGVNTHNERVASGCYLAVLRIDDPTRPNVRVTKLLYLK